MAYTLPGGEDERDELGLRVVVSGGALDAATREMLAELAVWGRARREQGTGSLASGVAAHLALPALRAYWPGSSVDEAGALVDLSGQGRHLAAQGTGLPLAHGTRRSGTVLLSRHGDQYYSRAHEAGLSLTAGLAAGAWVQCSGAALPATLLGKTGGPGVYGWALALEALGPQQMTWRFYYSADGTSLAYEEKVVGRAEGWHHVAATFTPFEPALFVDGVRVLGGGGLPAALAANTAPFTVGWSALNPAQTLDGRLAHVFVCAAPLEAGYVADLYQATRYLVGA
jgi:hypothetical protein